MSMRVAERVRQRFASAQLIEHVRSRNTSDSFAGAADLLDFWREGRKELQKYAKVMERWAPLYRRIGEALETPNIVDMADFMDARKGEIAEATALCDTLTTQATKLDAILTKQYPEGVAIDELREPLAAMPEFAQAVATADKIWQIFETWVHEDVEGYLDTSLEEYLHEGKLATRLANGEIPPELYELADLPTVAFGFLSYIVDSDWEPS